MEVPGWAKVGALVLVVGLVASGTALYFFGGQGTGGTIKDPRQTGQDETQDGPTTGPWDGRDVKKDITLEALDNADVTSGTIHIFSEKPKDSEGNVVWDNPRTIDTYFNSEYETDTLTVSSSETTFEGDPSEGPFYLVIESSGKYDAFRTLELPHGSEEAYDGVSLTDYNAEPQGVTFTLEDKYTPSLSAFDLGVTSNASSVSETYEADQEVKPNENTVTKVWKYVVQTGSADPTSDSDDDGTYDEGIKKYYVSSSGAGLSSESTTNVWYPQNGINKLEGDSKHDIMMDSLEITRDDPLSLTNGVIAVNTEDGSSVTDGDEKLSDGEEVFKFQIFMDDASGTSAVSVQG